MTDTLEQTIDMVKSYNIDISWACTTYEQAQNIVNYDPVMPNRNLD